MTKPIVFYQKHTLHSRPEIGEQVLGIVPINHPSEHVSNTKATVTSRVTWVGANGEFETENTRYYPMIVEEHPIG